MNRQRVLGFLDHLHRGLGLTDVDIRAHERPARKIRKRIELNRLFEILALRDFEWVKAEAVWS